MGFDLIGKKDDKYFRNNVWYWHPLWDYVCDVCNIDGETRTHGHFNDGIKISAEQALSIAQRLEEELASGRAQAACNFFDETMQSLPDEACEYCNGTGTRNDMYVKGTCNACKGKGTVRPFETWYHLTVENIESFTEFCKESGGFEIW